jgi:hypothetical protein
MKHTRDELIRLVYDCYPRGILVDDTGYKETSEYLRLVAARKKAAAEDGPWRAMLRRLEAQFPADNVLNDSLGLCMGSSDGAYSCKVHSAVLPGSVTLGFLVSFLVPYYVVYKSMSVEGVAPKAAEETGKRLVVSGDTCDIFPAERASPDTEHACPYTPIRRIVGFDFSPAEQSYSKWIQEEIEHVWGYQRMPPDVGMVIVPDVATNLRYFGEATLYDCLFADDWLS